MYASIKLNNIFLNHQIIVNKLKKRFLESLGPNSNSSFLKFENKFTLKAYFKNDYLSLAKKESKYCEKNQYQVFIYKNFQKIIIIVRFDITNSKD